MAITVGSLHSTIVSEIPVGAMRQVQPTEKLECHCAFAANYGFGILSVALIMAVPLAT